MARGMIGIHEYERKSVRNQHKKITQISLNIDSQ